MKPERVSRQVRRASKFAKAWGEMKKRPEPGTRSDRRTQARNLAKRGAS